MSSDDARKKPRGLSARLLARLPVFPLPEMVFFPGTMLPLHVFEPRYRKMTADALASHKMLAVTMLLEPERPGGVPPRFASVMGVGEIVIAEPLPDGRFNLILEGRARVHMDDEVVTDEPYRLIRASAWTDEPREGDLSDAEASTRALVESLCQVLPEGGVLLRQVAAAQDSLERLVNVLASTLVTSPQRRQSLLESRHLATRLEQLNDDLAELLGRFSEGRASN